MDLFDPTKITTWISLVAAGLLFLLAIARLVIKSEVIKQITRKDIYQILKITLNRAFYVVILIVCIAGSISFFDSYVTNAMRSTAEEMKKSQQLIQEWALLEDRDRVSALNSLQAAAQSFNTYEGYFMYASALMAERKFTESILMLDKALALKTTKEAYLNKGVALQSLAKFDEALDTLMLGISSSSDSYNSSLFQSKLHYNIASTYLDIYQSQLGSSPDESLLSKAEKHLAYADKGLRGTSDYLGDLYALKGLLFEFSGDYQQSIEMYNKANTIRTNNFFGSTEARDIAVTNNNVASLLLKGFFDSERDNNMAYERALQYARDALYVFESGGYDIEKAIALYNIGEALFKLRRPHESLKHLTSSYALLQSYGSPYARKAGELIEKVKTSAR